MKKDTIAINLFGAPGTGKTTMAAAIFAEMKDRRKSCEMVLEFAKEAYWEGRDVVFENEIYMFAKKHHKMHILNGQVDFIITDSPLLMSKFYNEKYGNGQFNSLNDLALEQHDRFKNINIFLDRVKPYNKEGRRETEKEAMDIEDSIKFFGNRLADRGDDINISFPANINVVEELVDLILDYAERI